MVATETGLGPVRALDTSIGSWTLGFGSLIIISHTLEIDIGSTRRKSLT